jgi:hypothetical protein
MTNEEWWAEERRAAEFWRKVRENQMGAHERQRPNEEGSVAPGARNRESGTPVRRQLP